MVVWFCLFFYKQKTVYEFGTGYWIADVCFSDLSFITHYSYVTARSCPIELSNFSLLLGMIIL